jgi:hypothetical protein
MEATPLTVRYKMNQLKYCLLVAIDSPMILKIARVKPPRIPLHARSKIIGRRTSLFRRAKSGKVSFINSIGNSHTNSTRTLTGRLGPSELSFVQRRLQQEGF